MMESQISRLIITVYEAMGEPDLWQVFLTQYAELMKAGVCGFQVHHFSEHRSEALSFVRLPMELRRSYQAHYTKLNPWREHGQRLYVQGRVLLSQELCPVRRLRRSEFYDFARQLEGVHCTGAVIVRRGDQATTLTAMRAEGKEAFDEPERRITEVLLPHLTRVQSVQQQLQLQLQTASFSLLDMLLTGVLLLGPRGQVIYSNGAAEEIFRRGDGLALRKGVVVTSDSKADAALRHAIHAAASPGTALDCPAAVRVPRPSLRRDYQIVVIPLLKRTPQISAMPAPTTAVLITDPHALPMTSSVIRQLYGLTAKEAELAAKLGTGLSLEEAAHTLAIRYETARTHLRRIFVKTDTKRQSELVLLLARLPQPLPQR
jgi:DNA-binding CsgD family transcriptional regulator/PAS domain-containing protein